MNKKGFTLIELLAVIVILAIIALIATPIVLNIIKDSKDSATLQSAQFYLGAVETAVAQKIIDDPTFKPSSCEIQSDGNLKCDEVLVKLEINGETPSSGNITIEQGKIKDVSLTLSGKKFIKDGDKLLEPGLYDAEGKLIASWDKLVNDYGIDIKKNYNSGDQNSPGMIFSSNEVLNKGMKLILDDSVSKIGRNAFSGCTSLQEIIVPYGITNIGICAFYNSINLVRVTIPSSVTSIDQSVFNGCTNLEKIILPNSITSIGNWAFYGCESLEEIIIPDSVTSTGTAVFQNCKNLKKVIISKSLTTLESGIFNGCSNLTEIAIPSSVTSIGDSAFKGCTNLKDIKMTDGLINLGNYAFGATGLTKVTIPNNIKNLGEGVFWRCRSLEEITIPSSVTSIGDYIFNGCSKIKTINYTGSQVEWDAIQFGENWSNDMSTNYTITYNYASK